MFIIFLRIIALYKRKINPSFIIARPFVTAVYGGAEEGVKSYIDKIGTELEDTMKMCGVTSLKEITRASVWMK